MSRKIESSISYNSHYILTHQRRNGSGDNLDLNSLTSGQLGFVQEEVMDIFLYFLARRKDPQTKINLYSIKDLSIIFNHDESTIEDKLNGRDKTEALPSFSESPILSVNTEAQIAVDQQEKPAGGEISPLPEVDQIFPSGTEKAISIPVIQEEPQITEPEEESSPEDIQRAFFRGFMLGEYQVYNMISRGMVSVETDSANQNKIELIKATFGALGEMQHDRPEGTGVYLDKSTFDFIRNPLKDKKEIDKIFDKRDLFAPFLLGVLLAKLTPRTRHVLLKKEWIVRRIEWRFKSHFGERIGGLHETERNGFKTASLFVRHPERVFRLLFSEDSVQSLPFVEALKSSSFFKDRGIDPTPSSDIISS